MTTTSNRLAVNTQSLVKAGTIAGLVAGVANLVIFLIAKAFGADLTVSMGSGTTAVIFLQPLVASFIAVFLGALVLQLMLRLRSGMTIWTGLAIVIFVAYTAYAFQAATTTSTGLTLTLMHIIALAVALGLLLPVARRRAIAATA